MCPSFVHKPASNKGCYTQRHPWCVCKHYPNCPTADTSSINARTSSKKEKRQPKVKLNAANDNAAANVSKEKGSPNSVNDVKHDASPVTPKSTTDDVQSGNNSGENTLDSPGLEADNDHKDDTYSGGRSISKEEVSDDHVNIELVSNISVVSSSLNTCVSPDSMKSIVRNDHSTSSMSSFDVPTIITSHTSDLDVVANSSNSSNNKNNNYSSSCTSVVVDDSRSVYNVCNATALGGDVDDGNNVQPSVLATSTLGLPDSVPPLSSSSSSSGYGGGLLPVDKSDDDLAVSCEALETRRLSSLSVDMGGLYERRSSCLSVDACSLGCGIQCACSSDETHTDRRCSQASILDYKEESDHKCPVLKEDIDTDEGRSGTALDNVLDATKPSNTVGSLTNLGKAALESVELSSRDSLELDNVASSSAEPSFSFVTSDTKSVDMSIKSVDSDVSCLLAGDTLSTLLRNRFKKYEKSVFDPNSDNCIDNLSITSSLRVEYESVFSDSQGDLSTVDGHSEPGTADQLDNSSITGNQSNASVIGCSSICADYEETDETTRLIDKSSACEIFDGAIDERTKFASRSSPDNASSKETRFEPSRVEDECISLTLSADTDDPTADNNGTRKNSRDIYTKLEQMRKIKRVGEPQHSMNNLLVSDSGSEHVSLYARQPSESSISAMYSEDSVSCRSRSSRKTKDYYECVSQINSEDSASVKSRPMKDPESVSQMYASEDSASYRHQRLAKDYESISQTPTYDIADLESINERAKRDNTAHSKPPRSSHVKGRMRRRRVSDLSGPASDGVSASSNASTATSTTTRPPIKCCCMVS